MLDTQKDSLQMEARALTHQISSLDRAISSERAQPTPDLKRIETLEAELVGLRQQRFRKRQAFTSIVESEKAKELEALESKLKVSRSWISKHQDLTSRIAEMLHDLDAEISQSSRESDQSDFHRKLLMFRRALSASLEAMSRVRF